MVCVAQGYVFFVVLYRSLIVFSSFISWHCNVCLSSLYNFWWQL